MSAVSKIPVTKPYHGVEKMNNKLSTLVGGCILAPGLVGQSGLATAGSDFTMKARTSSPCKLANVDAVKRTVQWQLHYQGES